MLVTAEVALSLVLLAGVGLMLQSFWNLVGVDTGIASDQVVHVTFDWPLGPLSKYQTEAETRQLLNLMSDRVEVIPGVTAFSLSGFVPLSGQELSGGDGVHITMVDRPRPEAGARFRAETRLVSPGFFRALGIPLIEGRTWEAQYIAPKLRAREECACRNPPDPSWQLVPQEVVISVGMARTFWPGESALGKIFHEGDQDPDVLAQTLGVVQRSKQWDPRFSIPVPLEVIGVVADVRNTLEREPFPAYYVPIPRGSGWNIFVRTSADPAGLAQVLRHEIEAVNPNEIEVTQIRTVEQVVAELGADSRFRALLVVLFAVLATGITCLGLFGVLTYAVAQRTRELGIRMALGAGNSHIAGLVLSQGARMAGLGVALGLVLVFWVIRYMSSLLFGVVPLDPKWSCRALVDGFPLTFKRSHIAAHEIGRAS